MNRFEGMILHGFVAGSGRSFVWSRWLSPLRGIHASVAGDFTHRIRSGKQKLAKKAWAFLHSSITPRTSHGPEGEQHT